MALMSLGAAGLYSISVVQTRQTSRVANILPANEVAALNRTVDPWERKLGVYAEIEAAVVPDAPAQPDVAVESIVDDTDFSSISHHQGPADAYGWTSWSHTSAYNNSGYYHRSTGNLGSYFEFNLTGLTPGEYEVYTTYPTFSVLGTAIIHEIRDGGTVVATKSVDQTTTPSHLDHAGRMWEKLGFVQIDSGTLSVRIQDGPGGVDYVLADAILVRSRRSLEVVSIAETAGGGVTATLQVAP